MTFVCSTLAQHTKYRNELHLTDAPGLVWEAGGDTKQYENCTVYESLVYMVGFADFRQRTVKQ